MNGIVTVLPGVEVNGMPNVIVTTSEGVVPAGTITNDGVMFVILLGKV
jgi:hypothetical protein